MNSVYLFSFNMQTPMLSRRHVPQSFKVDNSMIKVGITKNLDSRIRDYRTTYKCSACDVSHFQVLQTWQTELSIKELQAIEIKLKANFIAIKGEYFDKNDLNKITKWIDGELT